MKKFFTATTVILILLALFFVSACDSAIEADEPEITVTDIDFDSSILSQTRVVVSMDIENTNGIEASLNKLLYDIYFGYEGEWLLLGEGEKGQLQIEKEAVSNLLITTMISDQLILGPMMELFSGQQACFIRIDGDAWMHVGLAYFQIPFKKEVRVFQEGS